MTAQASTVTGDPTTLVRVVEIPSGPGVTAPLLAAADPAGGIAVARVRPDTRTRHELLADLLDGLGMSRDVSGWDKSADADAAALVVWLAAHPITDLVVVDAQAIPPDCLPEVLCAAAVAGTAVWLCEEEPGERYLAARVQWPARSAALDELLDHLPAPPAEPARAPFPDVPLDNFATFLAACRDALDAADFACVQRRFDDERRRAAGWAARTDPAAPPGEDEVVGWLRGRLHHCRTLSEMLVVTRAVQAAMFGAGHFVQVDLPRLLATGDDAPEATTSDPATWRALLAYREPVRGAACALVAAGAGIDDLLAARVRDVTDDGAAVAPSGTAIEVHPGAAVFLRALVLARTGDGAGGDDALFATEDGPIRDRMLVRYVQAPLTDLGLAVATRAVSGARVDARRWANRWGVSVQAL